MLKETYRNKFSKINAGIIAEILENYFNDPSSIPENDRKILAELASEALDLAGAVCLGEMDAEKKARAKLLEKHAGLKNGIEGRFADRNVYSAGLTQARFNRLN